MADAERELEAVGVPVVMLSDVVEARKGRRRTACSDYVILVKATNSFEVARGSVQASYDRGL